MSLLESLEKRLLLELPGVTSHAKMVHLGRFAKPSLPEKHKIASVLILLYQKNGEWHIVLMKRTSRYGNDKHKGQISFPGGQAEPSDINKAATAIREAEEEIGIPANQIKIVGGLSDLYIPVSNFLVNPFIGFTSADPVFKPDVDEVEEIIEVPLNYLLEQGNGRRTTVDLPSGFQLHDVPFYDADGHVIWGATCMMLCEFFDILHEINFTPVVK